MKKLLLFCGLLVSFSIVYSQAPPPVDNSIVPLFTIGGKAPIVSASYKASQIAYDGNKYLYFASDGYLSKVDTLTGQTVTEVASPTFEGKPFVVNAWAFAFNKIYAIVTINYPITTFTKVLARMDTSMQIQSIETKLGSNLYSLTTNTSTGDVWVYSSNPMLIYKYDWDSGTILKSVTPIRNDAFADFMQVDEFDNLYLGYYNYNIQKLDNAGNLVLSFPGNCSDFKVVNNTKLVTIDMFDQKLVTYNAETAAEISRITLKDHPLIPSFKAPKAIVVQPNGTMWVLDIGKYGPNNFLGGPLVYKIKEDGTWISCYGTELSGIKPNGLLVGNPELVTVDSRGWIYTATSGNAQIIEDLYYGPNNNISFFPILVFTPDGRHITNINSNGSYNWIMNMEAGPNKLLYCSFFTDPVNSTIFGIDSVNTIWNNTGLTAADPFDFIFDNHNRFFYVKDQPGYGDDPLIYQYNMSNSQSKTIGTLGNDFANDEVFYANGIARNSKGEFIITDFQQHKVYVMDSLGNNMRIHHTYGNRDNEVKAPARVVVDKYDNIFITEAWNNRIKITDRFGKLIKNIGIPGNPWGFIAPSDIAIDTACNQLYVADRNHNCIKVYKLNYPFTIPLKSFETDLTDSEIQYDMYPNPMKETLHIVTNSTITKVTVYTITGIQILVEEPKIASTQYELHLDNQIQSNLYFIKVETENGVINSKIIKK